MKKLILFSSILIILAITIGMYLRKDNIQPTYDISSPEAVVKVYFLALNNKDSKFIETTITDKDSHIRTKTSDLVSAELLELNKYTYTDEKVTFRVKYSLQLKKGKDMVGENGINSKFITLFKDNENNRWIIRDIGEG
ncbi:hypothetical protein JHL18_10540 [Clostridium sp. YIM B02505]|uniref:DUF4829 domain-containing protein n=1 Tax=Clostridium yunnanense TaxID=2800325 RepID=A0ABS1ENY0_9CLOT|nr:hypothetical protein [Clostridium yunnanense]MBK1811065.1 hypothetical protein [Clostridium yunnanense]